jgi:hypothetical protein
VELPAGTIRISPEAADDQAATLGASGWQVYRLPLGICDKSSFDWGVRSTLPLDPTLEGPQHNWDAIEDSIWGGLNSLPDSKVVIVWKDAGEMAKSSSDDFAIAESVLATVAVSLGDPLVTNGPVQQVLVVLGGDWSETARGR